MLKVKNNSDLSLNNKPSYCGVDLFKFFFAICIVALHTESLGVLPDTVDYIITRVIFRLAVPYFFVASGFFLGLKLFNSKQEQYKEIIKGYCIRLLKPLIFFEIISLIYYGAMYIMSQKGVLLTLSLLGQSIIFYPFGALWYVQACIVGALLLYPFLKRNKLTVAIIIGVILYSFALLANNYSFLIVDTPLESIVNTYLKYCVSARNGLFTGFVSLSLGMMCSKIHTQVLKKPLKLNLVTLLLFVFYIAEVLIIRIVNKAPLDDASLYITHLLFIPALFISTLQIKPPIKTKISVLLRNLSTGVYFLHRPILYVVNFVCTIGWINFFVVSASAICICLFIYKTHLKPFYSLLK